MGKLRRIQFLFVLVPVILALVLQRPMTLHLWQRGGATPQTQALRPGFRGDLSQLPYIPMYRIQANLDVDQARIEGQLELLYTNTTGVPLDRLYLRPVANIPAVYGGQMTVDRVTHGSQPLDVQPSQSGVALEVPLAPPLPPGEEVALGITFTTQLSPPGGPGYGILRHSSRITTLAGWYPMLAPYESDWRIPPAPRTGDALLAQISLYDVTLTVPREYTLVATGEETLISQTDTQATWHIVSGPVREVAVALSDRFEETHAVVGNTTVTYYALPASSPRTSLDTALQWARNAYSVYNKRFGPYPYSELDVVEAPITIGGYEFSGMVFLDDALRSSGSPVDFRYLIGHELAHQWWYGLVGSDSIREPWLDEAMASYSAEIFLEDVFSVTAGRALVNYWRSTYGLRRAGDPPVNSSSLEFSSWLAYRTTVYYRGALFLDALRQQIGDAAFFQVLQRYLAAFRYRWATTEEFLGTMESVTGQNLNPLFQTWFQVGEIEPAP